MSTQVSGPPSSVSFLFVSVPPKVVLRVLNRPEGVYYPQWTGRLVRCRTSVTQTEPFRGPLRESLERGHPGHSLPGKSVSHQRRPKPCTADVLPRDLRLRNPVKVHLDRWGNSCPPSRGVCLPKVLRVKVDDSLGVRVSKKYGRRRGPCIPNRYWVLFPLRVDESRWYTVTLTLSVPLGYVVLGWFR